MASPSPRIDRGEWLCRRGFTLVEALIASVILAILALGVAGAVGASYSQTIALNQNAIAVSLARELIEEIAAKPLLDPTSGNTTPASTALTAARSTFTGAGNYNLYSDHGASVTSLAGTTLNLTGGQVFTRAVTVQAGAVPTADTQSPSTDFDLVTVTVTAPSGQKFSLSRVVANYTFTR